MNIITQPQLVNWLDSMAKERPLIAPRHVAGVLLYRPVESSNEIAWGSSRPLMSVKDVLFPPTERLLNIEKVGQEVRLTQTFPEENAVIFGVRPCDARGMQVLDALFLDSEPVDPYYARRRENTALIGMACREMGPSCFCTSMGGAPDDTRGVDIFLTELAGGFLRQIAETSLQPAPGFGRKGCLAHPFRRRVLGKYGGTLSQLSHLRLCVPHLPLLCRA